MYRLFTTAQIINILSSAEDLDEKGNVHFPKLSDIETLESTTSFKW